MIKVTQLQVSNMSTAIRSIQNDPDVQVPVDTNILEADPRITDLHDQELLLTACTRQRLRRQVMQHLIVSMDIIAPGYFWKEFDGSTIPTIASSVPDISQICDRELTMDDFSADYLDIRTRPMLEETIKAINDYLKLIISYDPADFEIYGCPSKELLQAQVRSILPNSYNQTRTITMTYESALQICIMNKEGRVREWRKLAEILQDQIPYMLQFMEAELPFIFSNK